MANRLLVFHLPNLYGLPLKVPPVLLDLTLHVDRHFNPAEIDSATSREPTNHPYANAHKYADNYCSIAKVRLILGTNFQGQHVSH